MNQLDNFFKPCSVAVIGVSDNPRKIGHVIFRNFVAGSFKGKVFPVNPGHKKILTYDCFSSVLKIKEKIDLAVIVVPAKIVHKILIECGKKRIHNIIIITAGFKEIGNTKEEEELKKTIKKYKMRVIGPNCVGIFDPYSFVDTIFLPSYKLERPGKGDIAFISQSGALGSVLMDWMAMKGYHLSKFISYGNAIDVDESDLIKYLAEDKKTRVICAYVEGVDNGRKLFNAAKNIVGKKPIIFLKGGITNAGNKAAQSHTGSLAGEPAIYNALFRQTEIIKANNLEQVFDYARVFSTQPKPKGNRIQVITNGGGIGVLISDWVIKNNLILSEMDKETIGGLKKQLPNYVILKNPIDLTGDSDAMGYRIAIDAALNDKNVDTIILAVLFQIPTLTSEVVDIIINASSKKKKPILVVSAGGRYTEVMKKTLEDNGVPCFSYPESVAEAAKALCEYI